MKDNNGFLNGENKRIFISVILSSEIKSELSRIKKNIDSGHSKIRWVNPELLHITLEFLGNQSSKKIEKIKQLLMHVANNQKIFSIALSSSIGVFPTSEKPRVIWVGIKEGGFELERLSKAIKNTLIKHHILKDFKGFHSHITIGRVKYLADKKRLMDNLNQIIVKHYSQKINSIELMESELTSKGPIYHRIEQFSLLKKNIKGAK